MMAKKFFFFFMMALLVTSSWAEEDDEEGPQLTEEQVLEIMDTHMQHEKENLLKELELLDYLSNHSDDSGDDSEEDDEDDAGRSAIKDKVTNAGKNVVKVVKKKCDCKSHKVCGCCIKKAIKIPKTNTVFKPKFCGNVTIFPEEKKVGFNLLLGGISLFKKRVSLKEKGKQCIKMPKVENIELCFKMKVEESEEKGLTSCIKGQANLMVFVQKFRFPCFSFKDGKITADEVNHDEDEEEGVSLNIKGAYKGFKKLFGIGSKKTTPAPDTNNDF